MASEGKPEKPKTPITVVTGFLGAGKTTLVNRILTEKHGRKIAVIENEYGEVGIDDALVMETKEEIFEMNNGCVCCTVRGDLIRILNKLLKRRDKFDAILIETTGLANPAPVIQTFFVDDDIKDACLLDAVLTVVDAKHVMLHLDEEKPEGVINEAVQQIAFADKVLLNKVDLVDDKQKQAVINRMRKINAAVEVIECVNAQAPLDKLLGINAFSLEKLLAQDPEFLDGDNDHDHHHHDHDHHHHDHDHCDADCKEDHEHHHHHDHDHKCDDHCHHEHEHEHKDSESHEFHHGHHLDHKHDDRVSSVGIVMDGNCDMEKLNNWIGTLLRERGADLFRSKGILSIDGSDDRHVFHGVHMLLQFSSSAEGAGRPWSADEKRVNKLVFIGKNLNREELTNGFKECLVTSA